MKSLKDFNLNEITTEDIMSIVGGEDCEGTRTTFSKQWLFFETGHNDWDDEGCC